MSENRKGSGGRFAGRVALVSGASSGVGRAVATQLALEGATIGAVARSVDALGETVAQIESSGGRAIALPADVRRAAEVESAIAQLVRSAGGLDLIAHAAGVSVPVGSVEEHSEEDWETIFDTNAKSCFLLSKFGVPAMRVRGGGAVVNVSSVCATAAIPEMSIYAASKAAVSTFTRVLALGYAKEGIRFNAVAPGLVRTPMTAPVNENGESEESDVTEGAKRVMPLGRVIEPYEVANLVLFLLSDEASAISGSTHLVDGAWLAQINLGEIFGPAES